jgi:hypothetical protein
MLVYAQNMIDGSTASGTVPGVYKVVQVIPSQTIYPSGTTQSESLAMRHLRRPLTVAPH